MPIPILTPIRIPSPIPFPSPTVSPDPKEKPVPNLDNRVPAVLLRLDRNPFHHGTLGAVRSLGRADVEVHLVAGSAEVPSAVRVL